MVFWGYLRLLSLYELGTTDYIYIYISCLSVVAFLKLIAVEIRYSVCMHVCMSLFFDAILYRYVFV